MKRILVLCCLAGLLLPGALLADNEDKPSLLDHIAPPLPQAEDFVAAMGRRLKVGDDNIRFWGIGLSLADWAPKIVRHEIAEEEADEFLPLTEAEIAQRLLEKLSSFSYNLLLLTDSPTGGMSGLVREVVAQSRNYGIRIGLPGAAGHLGQALPADAAILDDPTSQEEWQASLPPEGLSLDNLLARVWDPRLELLGIDRMRENARVMNGRTGLRLADDPAVAYWELAAGEQWFERMLAGEWQSLPLFQVRLLLQRWNAWLYAKYETDDALASAWGGLRPAHESLDNDTCLLTPLEGTEIDPVQRTLLGIELKDSDYPPVTGMHLSDVRRADVRQFLFEIWQGHKEREELAFRRWGNSARVAALSWHRKLSGAPEQSNAKAASYMMDYQTLLRQGLSLPDHETGRPVFLHVEMESNVAAEVAPDFFVRILQRLETERLAGVLFWPAVTDFSFDSESASGTGEIMSRIAHLAFRNDISLPPLVTDGTNQQLESDYMVVFRSEDFPRGEAASFANGISFEWLKKDKRSRTKTEKESTEEAGEGEADSVVPEETQVPPEKCQITLAFLSDDGSPLEKAATLRLFVVGKVSGIESVEKKDSMLALQADFLLQRHYRTCDMLGRELERGIVGRLPFVVQLQSEVFEVEFSTQAPADTDRRGKRVEKR